MDNKIVFIIWNSFQLLQFKPLLNALPNALLVIEKRKKAQKIDRSLLNSIVNRSVCLKPNQLYKKLNGHFDILITQTVFEQIHLFDKTKIVMLQYGYAKEPHNYGTWRAFADLNLVYGEYARKKIAYFSPTVITGCPRYDQWFDEEFHQRAKEKYEHLLNKSKKTILYAPSWGELCSFKYYIDELYQLRKEYNILVKLHHNTLLLSNKKNNYQQIYPEINFFYQNEDILSLISVSNIVLSDYSGAVFDAMFCHKKIGLLSIPNLKLDKVDNFSIEISQRDKFGYIVNVPEELKAALSHIERLCTKTDYNNYHSLFYDTRDATKNVLDSLDKLMSGEYDLTQQQRYLRDTVKAFYSEKSKNKTPPSHLPKFLNGMKNLYTTFIKSGGKK